MSTDLAQSSVSTIWSAIAATFSAISAILVWRVQRRSLHENTKPEIIITGWERKLENADLDVLTFSGIKNIGKGPAFYVNVTCLINDETVPIAEMSNIRVPILAVNEAEIINGRVLIWWKNISGEDESKKYLMIPIDISCWDSSGNRLSTTYELGAWKIGRKTFVGNEIAPAVSIHNRRSWSIPNWKFKALEHFKGYPLLGNYLNKKINWKVFDYKPI